MKFAYLIMAHDNLKQLTMLLKLLDFNNNDIFLHIDKKSDIEINECKNIISRANIFVFKEINVYWGDISQTYCQMFLLKHAIREYHDYYHLISGKDLPLMTNKEIISFFKNNNGKQYIHFESYKPTKLEQCIYYHFFDSWIKKNNNSELMYWVQKLNNILLQLQKKIRVKRKLFRGANWFSITHDFATEYCNNADKMLESVKWTKSSDECILQTYCMLFSPKYELYKNTSYPCDYTSINRAIDWERGNPYVWREGDYKYLINSGCVFGRKFDQNIDNDIIIAIYNYLSEKEYPDAENRLP